jgi:hypothetical protein
MAVDRTNNATTYAAPAVRLWRRRLERYHTNLDRRVASVASVVALSSTLIRVTFAYPMSNNAALAEPGNYAITTSTVGAVVPEVLTVAPEVTAEPTYVTIRTSEMTNGATYTCTVYLIEAA